MEDWPFGDTIQNVTKAGCDRRSRIKLMNVNFVDNHLETSEGDQCMDL